MTFWMRLLLLAAGSALAKWAVAMNLLDQFDRGGMYQSDRYYILGLMALLCVLDALLLMIIPRHWRQRPHLLEDCWPMIVFWVFSTVLPLVGFSVQNLNDAHNLEIWYGGTLMPGMIAATVSGLLVWALISAKQAISRSLQNDHSRIRYPYR